IISYSLFARAARKARKKPFTELSPSNRVIASGGLISDLKKVQIVISRLSINGKQCSLYWPLVGFSTSMMCKMLKRRFVVPDEILKKPGALSAAEHEIMKRHVLV